MGEENKREGKEGKRKEGEQKGLQRRVGKREGGKEEEAYSTPLLKPRHWPSWHGPYFLLLLSPLFDDLPGPDCGD